MVTPRHGHELHMRRYKQYAPYNNPIQQSQTHAGNAHIGIRTNCVRPRALINRLVTHAERSDHRVYKQSAKKQRHHSVSVHQQLIFQKQSTMKCLAILLLALVAVVMALEKTPEVEQTKEVTPRDKRGLYSGVYSPYSYGYGGYAPLTYNSLPYTYTYPYAYPYAYNHYRYPYHYPYYNHPVYY
ncbi:uncharacterized protein LOC105428531 [Pogonomyrmex barbatus]|uniref:Uncharacterized protein LOC105428531 n=1 Tax=Pogonomyrmex barbatus TaxID=144034 RepID=A0A6I9WE34_9HYME|nr:uncharacterized protein LOC105428531 [Pogonomyrmex barbatus]